MILGKFHKGAVIWSCVSVSAANNYIDHMQREKLLLPPLHEPLTSSRITSFQEYAQWDRQRKEAYRNELKEEMKQHDRSR